jgi:superfamily II DNA/RNA helicase
MKKAVKINYEPPVVEEHEKVEEQISHFYVVGDKLTLPISLYVTLKFGLVNPKILILVEDIREVYRYALFLERCHIGGVGVYNTENPINLRFYVLSVWMNGSTNILIATKDILRDLKNNVFKANARKAFKGKAFELINMTSIITLGLGFL